MRANRACFLFVVACVAACFAQGASATDLKDFAPAPAPPQKPDWAGFYIRNNSGGSSDRAPWTTLPAPAGGFSAASSPSVNDTFGYNFQSGNFVFGLEGTFAAANFDGKFTSPYVSAPYLPAAGWSPNMNWLGSVGGRVGYSFGQWMPYVKGGFAAANFGSPLQGSPIGAFSQGSEIGGWTAGLGVEYQISPKWSLGVEYLYTDLGSGSGGANGAPIAGSPDVYSTALKSQSLLGRLNYKPGW